MYPIPPIWNPARSAYDPVCYYRVRANSNQEEVHKLTEELQKCNERIHSLEPKVPEDIPDINHPFFTELAFPTEQIPIRTIMDDENNKIPFEISFDNPDWERMSYRKEWHSTVSVPIMKFVPFRIQVAHHRIFSTYAFPPGLLGTYAFYWNLGLYDYSNYFYLPQNYQNGELKVVVMQATVNAAYMKGNQLVLVASPRRKGLQIITVQIPDLHIENPEESLLIQLATKDGDEIDYVLQVTPDKLPSFYLHPPEAKNIRQMFT